jgi:hypothetical protein
LRLIRRPRSSAAAGELAAARLAAARRQDLSEPVGCGALALENNYDIAIARINLDIADTDLLRAGGFDAARRLDGVVDEHAGRNDLDHHRRRRTGRHLELRRRGTGASGLVLSTNGGGPTPEKLWIRF